MADFRRVLDIFAFKLTEPQWRHLQSRLQMVDKSINYVLFLENYAMSDQEVGTAQILQVMLIFVLSVF